MSHGEHEATSLPGVDRRLWGKHRGLPAPYPVICHLIDTAALAGALWDEWMDGLAVLRAGAGSGRSGADFRKLVCFWAGLHDLGKVSPSFQVMVDELYGELIDQVPEYGGEGNDPVRRLRHNEVTQWALVKILRELGYPAGARARQDVGHQIAQLLGGHHGRFCAALTGAELRNPLRDGLGEGAWEQQRRVHAEVLT